MNARKRSVAEEAIVRLLRRKGITVTHCNSCHSVHYVRCHQISGMFLPHGRVGSVCCGVRDAWKSLEDRRVVCEGCGGYRPENAICPNCGGKGYPKFRCPIHPWMEFRADFNCWLCAMNEGNRNRRSKDTVAQ
jgi:ribosomal protein L32